MAGVEIDFQFPDWAAKIKAREDRINRFIAAQIQTNRGMLFDSEGAHNGHPKWAALAFRAGQTLSRRGTLRKSIAPTNPRGNAGPDGIVEFAGQEIRVGTKLFYARMMNNGTVGLPGGVLRPKKAKALKIPLPKGKNANSTAKALRKDLSKSAMTRRKLSDKIDNAQTMEAEIRYRRQLAALEKKRAAKGRSNSSDFLFLKSVTIPARDFESWNDKDQEELDTALANLILGMLND